MAEILTKLVRVDLFEDRATVVRELELPSAPGRHNLEIRGLSPLVAEARLSFAERAGLTVESARVERMLVSRDTADPALAQELAAQERALSQQVAGLRAQLRRVQERRARAAAWASSAQEWAGHALLRQDDPAAWVQALRGLSEEEARAVEEEVALEAAVGRADTEHAQVAGRLAFSRQGRPTAQATLHLQVLSEAGGRLELRYTVPCALWRPVHRAALRERQVDWEVCAMAWNLTGEDWLDAPLRFSTARPGDTPAPPQLTEDRVGAQPRDRQIQAEVREEAVQVAREGQARPSEVNLGVDDGGEVRLYDAPGATRLPSDGLPVLVPLERWSAPAEPSWQATPEKDARVALRSRQLNTSRRPLLAGPVYLTRGDSAVGRGRVALVPPGEPFELGWGSHDSVRITRRQDIERSTARLTGTQTLSFKVGLRVNNLGAEPVEVQVRERLPVSELKEVTVSAPTAKTPFTGPDADGFVRWTLTLGPRERRDLLLEYSLEANSRVTLPW